LEHFESNLGGNSVCDAPAKIIDADDVAGRDRAALLTEKPAALRVPAGQGKPPTEKEIHEEKDPVEPVLDPLSAATPAFMDGTVPAHPRNPALPHASPGLRDGCPITMEKTAEVFILEDLCAETGKDVLGP